MQPKYRAIWIPSGEDMVPGTICIDPWGQPYRLVHRNGGFSFVDESVSYPGELSHKFKPAKLYLCDLDLRVGSRCYNPRTQECFDVQYETYITGTNKNDDDYNVVGMIDPYHTLRAFTPIEEENIAGYVSGDAYGEERFPCYGLKNVPLHYYATLPKS